MVPTGSHSLCRDEGLACTSQGGGRTQPPGAVSLPQPHFLNVYCMAGTMWTPKTDHTVSKTRHLLSLTEVRVQKGKANAKLSSTAMGSGEPE